jgi:hypothetical protein
LNCIKNLDIVGLVETHTTSSFISPLDDYKIFHTRRVQNNRAKRKLAFQTILEFVTGRVQHHLTVISW